MNSLQISLQNEDPSTMTVLSSLPEHGESIEESVRLTPTRNRSSGNNKANPLEESWNGLFLQSSISELHSSTSTDCTSNKKMGHASFTDFGLYAKHNPSSNNSAKLTPEDIQAAKSQLMKMRLERMLKSKTSLLPPTTSAAAAGRDDRLHQSDSALLRKNSEMDTTELEGTWYKAKHPRRRGSLAEQLTQSAPTGSLDLLLTN